MRELLVVYLKGFAMGTADAVPGVSGGTIALIAGIYDRLIRALTALDPRALRPALRLHDSAGRAAFREAMVRMDVPFLAALGLGVGTALVTFAHLVDAVVEAYPVPSYAFFFGLIAASAVVLYGEIGRWTPPRIAVSLAGVVVAAVVTGATATGVSHTTPIVFLAGAIAICAMVLPGVSGAFFLLVLGQYTYLAGVLTDFVDALAGLADGGSVAPVVESGTVVAVFGAGAVVGLFSMAHLVRRALDRYRAATLAFLVSLMVGALRFPIEKVAAALGETPAGSPGVAVLAAALGAGAVLVFDRYTADLEYDADPARVRDGA
ncbi:DUF368 domain-containing protein [Salinilacihabitans rarus]|uniref:DUF368 domain-containing protein n=1 Tax=Salinilacihabitans rarus TaxID=2961596 RepID=UPI0020C8CDEF|nr:DUF368 domain-containing protein [Salinilacihabitans rarus]